MNITPFADSTPSQSTQSSFPLGIDPPPMESFASHSLRNPLQPVIQPNQRNPKATVDKLSAQVAQAMRREKQAEFLEDLTKFQHTQSTTVADLASKYHRKPEYISKVMAGQTHYKRERMTNLYNAKLAWMRRQLKQEGRSLTLPQLQEEVKNNEHLRNLTKEQEEDMIRQLDEEKNVKKTGARMNNRAAAHDYQATVRRIQEEITSLESRTGITAFAFFTRSHINDSMQPVWIATSGALDFLPESLQTSAGEVGRKFELWACTRGDKKVKNELLRLQTECSETIVQKLNEILNRRNIRMSYQYYDTDIRSKFKVHLRGWPAGVRFIAPGKITTLYEIRTLHEALHDGTCIWVAMSESEVGELSAKLRGQPVSRKRNPRKKKGDENKDTSEGRSRKRKRTTKSAPTVDDNDNE